MASTGYLSINGFLKEALTEVNAPYKLYDHLILSEHTEQPLIWCQNIWKNPKAYEFKSITEAAKILKNIQPLWSHYPYKFHRRAHLIQENLPVIKAKALDFLGPLPQRNLGSWTLIEPNVMIASSQCSSVFPNGEFNFNEDKEAPSRAYLKLWELFTVHGIHPKKNEKCLDLGSSPGGWTWVLKNLKCEVVSVDKAPLREDLLQDSKVQYLKADAFNLKCEDVGEVDWLFSDIICYPERLYELVKKWLDSGLAKNFVCTIKFKGETDHEAVRKFSKISGSRLIHLHHNKHELTWIRLQ